MNTEQCRFLAEYNTWMNTRLYAVCAEIPDAERKTTRAAFFGSIHGTLNHLMVADLLWLARFRGQSQPPLRLDQILHDDFGELRAAREALDGEIAGFFAGLDQSWLDGTITYSMITRPETVTEPVAPLLMHFFNHQTHHRGQAHALLTRLGREAPALDLVYYLREAA